MSYVTEGLTEVLFNLGDRIVHSSGHPVNRQYYVEIYKLLNDDEGVELLIDEIVDKARTMGWSKEHAIQDFRELMDEYTKDLIPFIRSRKGFDALHKRLKTIRHVVERYVSANI